MSLIECLQRSRGLKETYDIIDYFDNSECFGKDENGNTPLMYLIEKCSSGKKCDNYAVMYLLNKISGTYINFGEKNKNGDSVLSLAIKNKCEQKILDKLNEIIKFNQNL